MQLKDVDKLVLFQIFECFNVFVAFGYGELYISMSIYCLVPFYICQGGLGVIVKVGTNASFGTKY